MEIDAPEAPAAPAAPGGTFAVAWRNYMKTVFAKGYFYKVSCCPASILYIAEHKTLAGKEERGYEGEALGRKMAVVFFERAPGPRNLVQRARRDAEGMHQILLTIAELLLALGIVLPADPERTTAEAELLLEKRYEHLEIMRFEGSVQPAAPGVHVYQLGDEDHAETALVSATPADELTKMMLARALYRNEELLDGENLQGAWNKPLATLRGRTAHLAPAPAAPRGRRRR